MRSFYGLASLFFLILLNSSIAQSIYESYNGFTVPTQVTLPVVEVHPSLWFKSAAIADIKNKRNLNAYALVIGKRVDSLVSKYTSGTASATTINTRPIAAKLLAFNWLMKGDTTSRRKAIECLLIAYDNVPRTASSANFGGSYDEIYRATWLQNYCAAYDWLQPELTVVQDTLIRSKLIAETVLLRDNMIAGVRYASRPHNHRSKPAWALVTAGLTLTSHPKAKEWIEFGLAQCNTVTKYMFSGDGIYREGSHYYLYSAVNFIPYLWQMQSVLGVNHFSYYKPAFEMVVKLRSSKGWLPNIEDSYIKPFPTHMVAGAYKNESTELGTNGDLASVLQWHWQNTAFFTIAYTGATNDVTWELDEYLTYDPTVNSAAPNFPGTFQTDCGVVMMRDSAMLGKKPLKTLMYHGVAECDNHQHADLLSYVIEYNGTLLACDPGYGKDGFDDNLRNWYISPNAHNVLMIKGKAPLDIETNVKPTQKHFINAPWFALSEKYAKTDATNGRVSRGIAFIDKTFWIVYDAATASASTNYLLNIHSRGALQRNGASATWTTTTDMYGGEAKLFSHVESSANSVITTKTGTTSLYKDEVAQSYMEVALQADSASFMHVLYPAGKNDVIPGFVSYRSNNIPVIETQTYPKKVFLTNVRNKKFIHNNILTDAVFTALDVDTVYQNILKLSLTDTKEFQYNSQIIFMSDKPVTFSANFSEVWRDEIYFDTLASITNVTFKPSVPIDSTLEVTINGISTPFTVQDGLINFNVQGTGVIVVRSGLLGIKSDVRHADKDFSILGIYPNPFNNAVKIRLQISSAVPVDVHIHNSIGELVKSFNISGTTGLSELYWDGNNNNGIMQPSGTYIITANDGNTHVSSKCIMIK